MNDPADDADQNVEAFNRGALNAKRLSDYENAEVWLKILEFEAKEKLQQQGKQ